MKTTHLHNQGFFKINYFAALALIGSLRSNAELSVSFTNSYILDRVITFKTSSSVFIYLRDKQVTVAKPQLKSRKGGPNNKEQIKSACQYLVTSPFK